MRPGERTLRRLLGPINDWLADPLVTDVCINRPGAAHVERRGQWSNYAVPELDFSRLDTIATLAASMSRKDVGPAWPLCYTELPDGERCQIARPPAVRDGILSLTIRRPPSVAPDYSEMEAAAETMVGEGSSSDLAASRAAAVDAEIADLLAVGKRHAALRVAVKAKRTIVVCGDTGSGKTYLARALVGLVPEAERLVTIEDTNELKVARPNSVSLFYAGAGQTVSNHGAVDLVEASLRMRPDRVLFGELRDGAAYSYLRSVLGGHPGSITTVHATSARNAIKTLATLARQSPLCHDTREDLTAMLHDQIDLVAYQERLGEGRYSLSDVWFCGRGKRSVPANDLAGPAAETGLGAARSLLAG